jgi:hypothetical protein
LVEAPNKRNADEYIQDTLRNAASMPHDLAAFFLPFAFVGATGAGTSLELEASPGLPPPAAPSLPADFSFLFASITGPTSSRATGTSY